MEATHAGRNRDGARCWDVRYRVDGRFFSRRFTQPNGTAGQAREWAKRLAEDFAKGLPFDPKARRFAVPEQQKPQYVLTVYESALDYIGRRWTQWGPKSRQAAVRALVRACTGFLRDGAPEIDSPCRNYVEQRLSSPTRSSEGGDDSVEKLLAEWSRPIAGVTWRDIEELVSHYRYNTRNPGKEVAASTERRFHADLGQFFSDVSAREGIPDPFKAYRTVAKPDKKLRQAQRRSVVDRDIVLSPEQVEALAESCSSNSSWGEVVVCFVLALGVCGLRPGEAAGLQRRDLDLRETGPGTITVRRTRRPVTERWLVDGEDAEWGPLKGRSEAEMRHVPIPSKFVGRFRKHLAVFCPGASSGDLVFQRRGHAFDPHEFLNRVWRPGRAALFPFDPGLPEDHPQQSKLSRLRPHDLRHAACSFWLREVGDLKVCQKWSGHRTLSVFLDIYQGVISDNEERAVEALERAWSES